MYRTSKNNESICTRSRSISTSTRTAMDTFLFRTRFLLYHNQNFEIILYILVIRVYLLLVTLDKVLFFVTGILKMYVVVNFNKFYSLDFLNKSWGCNKIRELREMFYFSVGPSAPKSALTLWRFHI